MIRDLSPADRLGDTELAAATLFLPLSVTRRPPDWAFIAPEISRYLDAQAPLMYRNIYEGLELAVSETEVATNLHALARVLFASWMRRIVSDSVGASLFGPAYLRAIAAELAQPATPERVTSIALNPDGTVFVEPPAHVRIRWTARWLTRMGYTEDAFAVRQGWDTEHGMPDTLDVAGTETRFPEAPVLEAGEALIDALYDLHLDALGSRLDELPGLADWSSIASDTLAAKTRLASGEPSTGAPRAVVAAAIDAALEAPEAAGAITQALQASLGATTLEPRARHRRTPAPVSQPSTGAVPLRVALGTRSRRSDDRRRDPPRAARPLMDSWSPRNAQARRRQWRP